jgi:uncharacterized protein (DUF1810 family)
MMLPRAKARGVYGVARQRHPRHSRPRTKAPSSGTDRTSAHGRARRRGPQYAVAVSSASLDPDPFDLRRFVSAQEPLVAQVTAELAAGAKTSHWMWFVFPQLKGLGRSGTALHYGIASLDEARAYAQHPVLGARLRHCCALLMDLRGRSALQIFGSIDALKLRSCLTLFERAAPQEPVFAQVLGKYYDGERDAATLQLLA